MTIAERNNKLKHFITCLKCEVSGKCCDDNCSTQYDAGNMGEIIENLEAISKALEQETVSRKSYDHEYFLRKEFEIKIDELQRQLEEQAVKAESILDKIRAEILEEKECAYADFERYKIEYLGQDWEDVQDSLPQDDFRYGMERCIDIIDKYKAETEE